MIEPMEYEFVVCRPTGELFKVIQRDDTHMRNSGMRLQVSPEGDGIEARFDAKGAGIQLPPLYTVQINYKVGGEFKSLYYGQVRQGGNTRNVDGEAYILRSLALRLDAVTLSPGFATPEQPAHLTVRALMLDVIASGQLGFTVGYLDTAITDLGFNARAVEASNSQIAGALLRQLVEDGAALGVDVRYGVDAHKQFYCRAATGTVLTLAPEERGVVRQLSPVAEKPVTAVMWFLAQDEKKKPVTYVSRSPEAALYGDWVKPLAIDPERVPAWKKGGGLWQWVDATGTDASSSAAVNFIAADGGPSLKGYELLRDGVMKTNSDRLEATVPPDVRLRYTPVVPHRRARIAIAGGPAVAPNLSSTALQLVRILADGAIQTIGIAIGAGAGTFDQATFYTDDPGVNVLGYILQDISIGETQNTKWTLFEFRVEPLDDDLLDRLARFHYSLPAPNPADVTLKVFRVPEDLTEQVALDDGPVPVAAWEYRISGGRGLELAALLGQRLDPEKLALAELIRALDNESVIAAVKARD